MLAAWLCLWALNSGVQENPVNPKAGGKAHPSLVNPPGGSSAGTWLVKKPKGMKKYEDLNLGTRIQSNSCSLEERLGLVG